MTEQRHRDALVFPGITPSPYPLTARFLLVNEHARALLATADEVLGHSVLDGFRDADTEFCRDERVAFLVVCLALAHTSAAEHDLDPVLTAGPSFGGVPAAVYVGALGFPDAVRLTAGWTDLVDAYFATAHTDIVTESFCRTPADVLGAILRELAQDGEWYEVACEIDHDFTMLSLRAGRVDWLRQRLRAEGGLPLFTMRPPMHCGEFGPLRDIVERDLVAGLRFTDPVIPVVSDHDARPLTTAAEVRTLLLDGIVRQVRWPRTLDTLARLGASRLVVSGPDGLWGRVTCARTRFEVLNLTPKSALRPRRRAPVLSGSTDCHER